MSVNIRIAKFKNNNNNLGYDMTKQRTSNVKYLRKVARGAKDEIKIMSEALIKKYAEGRITQLQTVENALFKLLSTDKRVAKSGIRLYEKTMSKYANQKPLNQRLDERKKRTFNVSSLVPIIKTAKKPLKKTGELKTYKWRDTLPVFKEITATSPEQAKEIYKQEVTEYLEADDYELLREADFNDDGDIQVTEVTKPKASKPENTLMRSAKYMKYHFIDEDDTYFKNDGYCVRDFFVGKYSQKIKKLTNDYFDELCYKSLGLNPNQQFSNPLDEDVLFSTAWTNHEKDTDNDVQCLENSQIYNNNSESEFEVEEYPAKQVLEPSFKSLVEDKVKDKVEEADISICKILLLEMGYYESDIKNIIGYFQNLYKTKLDDVQCLKLLIQDLLEENKIKEHIQSDERFKNIFKQIEADNKNKINNTINNNSSRWQPSNGVTPKMLNYICNELSISCYAFDITNKCFLKTISKGQNYNALVYYCINNHMYPITHKPDVESLTKKERVDFDKIRSAQSSTPAFTAADDNGW